MEGWKDGWMDGWEMRMGERKKGWEGGSEGGIVGLHWTFAKSCTFWSVIPCILTLVFPPNQKQSHRCYYLLSSIY